MRRFTNQHILSTDHQEVVVRKLIRPNRDDVIRWYVGLAMVVLTLSSGELSTLIGNATGIDNGMVRWLIGLSIVAIAFLVFVRYGPPADLLRRRDHKNGEKSSVVRPDSDHR